MESKRDERRALRCIALLSGFDEWSDNEFTRELRAWPDKFADDPDVECPAQDILDKAATLSDTVPSDFRMMVDADGGVVFEAGHGKYHIWDDGEVEWIAMRHGKVAERCVIPFAR